MADSQDVIKEVFGDRCAGCPACGHWPGHGDKPWCFDETYFKGKAGKPRPIEEVKKCPRDKA